MSEFVGFPKIPRLNREIVITEKIDGTNAQIFVDEIGLVLAGSRSQWLMPDKKNDNYGFAAWVYERAAELAGTLGPGRHFGEWWGQGIQRRYGLTEKRFSLFNTHRWHGQGSDFRCVEAPLCHVVPVLYRGDRIDGDGADMVDAAICRLRNGGSIAAFDFDKPEGVIVYHTAANSYFKATIDKDDEYKGK